MPYEIVRNDITKMRVDAIVNTANPEPIIGAGIDYAIHKAAGPKLLEARKRIGDIPVGRSVETPAFDLPAKYVLHTVSPAWQDGNHGEMEDLRRAYDAALNLALKLRCRSVAFPLMAAGTYGFPHDYALLTAVRAISEFALHHRMQIYLVLFSGAAFEKAGGLFADLKSFIDDNYVEARNREEYGVPAPDDGPGAAHGDLPVSPEERRREQYLRRRRQLQHMPNLSAAPREAAPPSGSGGKRRPAPPAAAARERRRAPSVGSVFTVRPAVEDSAAGSLEEFLRTRESGFTDYLLSLLQECGEKDSVVYHRARMSRQRFHKILNNKEAQPQKGTVIQLAIGLKLDLAQTQTLLGKAGYALSRSSKSDLVVQYYIERRTYDVNLINDALYDCGLPLLKTS